MTQKKKTMMMMMIHDQLTLSRCLLNPPRLNHCRPSLILILTMTKMMNR